MTTLKNPPPIKRSEDHRFGQDQGETDSIAQSQQQQANDDTPQADLQQSGDQETFTVSTDDWFKS